MRVGLDDPRQFLLALFQTAVAAADPHRVLPPCLPHNTDRRAIVIGAGKAAAAMASALEKNWAGALSGLVVTPYGHGEPCRRRVLHWPTSGISTDSYCNRARPSTK